MTPVLNFKGVTGKCATQYIVCYAEISHLY